MIKDIETINKLYNLYIKISHYMNHYMNHYTNNHGNPLLYDEFVKNHNKYYMPFHELLIHYLEEYIYIFDINLYNKLIELCNSDDEANHYIALELIYDIHIKNNP